MRHLAALITLLTLCLIAATASAHPLSPLEATTTAMKPGEWTLLPNSTPAFGTFNDQASAAYDFRRHNWYFSPAGGPALLYNFETLEWGRRVAGSSPTIPAQYDGVVWHDQRNSGLWISGSQAAEYAAVTGWATPIDLGAVSAGTAPVSFYRPLSGAIVIPLTAGQGPFEINRSGQVSRNSSTPWKTTGSGVGAYDWIRDQAYVFHNDGSATTFYVFPSSSLSTDPIGTATAASISQPTELTGATGTGHKCGVLFVDDYDMLFVWCGSGALWTYEPRNNRWTKYDNAWSDVAPTSTANAAINNRFIYLSELRVFAGFSNTSEGVWLYKWLSEPEPPGAVISGCADINGPCTELNNPASLTAWQSASVPASGGTVVVMQAHQVNGARSISNAWTKVVGVGTMTNPACLNVPPKPSCDRPLMYQTEAQHSAAGWATVAVQGGATTVQHLHLDHFAGSCITAGTGQYSRHRQMLQVIDTEIGYCAGRNVFTSADNRADFPDNPQNDKVILDYVQLHHAGGEHNIYCGVSGLCQITHTASWAPSSAGGGAGSHALKVEGWMTVVTDNLISAGDLDGETDCSAVQDWTLASATRGACRGVSPPLDGMTCAGGIIARNRILGSFRGGTNNNTSKICGTWVDQGSNVWKVRDIVWGKADQGQTLGAGQRKMALNWLTTQGDWYYDPTEYSISMYSVGSPGTFYGACPSTTLTLNPRINTTGGYGAGATWQNRGSISGCSQGSYLPMDGIPVHNPGDPPVGGYSIDDKSFIWGTVPVVDTGNLYWNDVAAGGLGTDEKEARNPYILSLFAYGNTFTCTNCTKWYNGGGTSPLPTGWPWVNQGTEPGQKYLSGDQSGPLTYLRWYCTLNPGDSDCTYITSGGVTSPDSLPIGYIDRSRHWIGANCLQGFPVGTGWTGSTGGFVFGAAGPTSWGFTGIPAFDAPRVITAGTNTCPAGTTTLPAWFIKDFLDPALYWRRGYFGTRSGQYYYIGGSSAH